MTKISSSMLSVGTLLRRAEDTGAQVRVLVQGRWLEGRVIGCDGLGAVLDDAVGQSLVRLDAVTAVTFRRGDLEEPQAQARAHGAGSSGPVESGPVTVPPQSRGQQYFLTSKPY